MQHGGIMPQRGKKVMKIWWVMASVLLLTGCAEEEKAHPPIKVQVASQQVGCVGITKQRCFEVRFDESESWQLLYDDIEGFEFEPGFTYWLEVQQQGQKQDDPNRSPMAWELVNVLQKVPVQD